MLDFVRIRSFVLIGAALAAGCSSSPDALDQNAEGVRAEAPLQHVALELPDAEAGAERLAEQGFDVVEGTVTNGRLEVIGSAAEIARLRELGYAPTKIAEGAPLDGPQGTRDAYPGLEEILREMQALATAHPDIAKVVDLTARYGVRPTAEGRHLFALKVSGRVEQEEDEPTYLLVANHHARELGTPVAALQVMSTLTGKYTTDERVRRIVDGNELWIAPTWNPDGLEHVHRGDNMWRKTRRPNEGGTFGVDLNRNYPNLWSSSCSGSTSKGSDTYKGPAPGSEPETQTMMAFANDRRFARALDLHSSGREVLVGYSCSTYALAGYFGGLGAELARQMGYSGRTRKPSAQGEHGDYQLGNHGSLFFLAEINTTFQPPYAAAQAEAVQILPGILWHMERPIPLRGHVRDAASGAPVAASIVLQQIPFTQGEKNSSGGPFGRYQAFVPAGTYTLEATAPGYRPTSRTVTIGDAPVELDLALSLVSP